MGWADGRGLRILAAFAALDPAMADAAGAGAGPCDALSVEMRLQKSLRGEALRFEGLSCGELAELLLREADGLSGRSLLALLWVLTRNRSPAFRPLEARVVSEVERRALYSLVSCPTPHSMEART